jgi:lipoyl(octanoyl) transferase
MDSASANRGISSGKSLDCMANQTRSERVLQVARLGQIDYADALNLQQAVSAARLCNEIADTLMLLEHPHVFTLGRGADERFLLNPSPDVQVYRVSRGGQVTYHGPGQLIGYPILKLEGADRDVIRYLRKLEEVIIEALGEYGIRSGRRDALTGVWVADEKIASIGVGIRRWTTLHGFAINVTTDLSYFDRIVPCGIAGCRMTSIAKLGRTAQPMSAFTDLVARTFAQLFDYSETRSIDLGKISNLASKINGEIPVHALS